MKFYFSFIFILSSILSVFSQTLVFDALTIESKVYDLFTTEPIKGCHVSLYSLPDSVLVSQSSMVSFLNGESVPTEKLSIGIQDLTKKYVLKVEKEGYIPEFINLDPSKAGRNQVVMPISTIYLEPKSKKLNEITVTASKVKFYHRGDTLVYNADAFVLPEGSMLDALLEQLPGVKMDDEGVITVDGKKVEYLLLDGKEFFSHDRKLMLKNIASYTVKNIDVYESHDERFDAAGRGQEKLMMDVKLKKEYQKGYIANLEAGYGTSDRWLGRLFGMVYTNKLRLSLIGNANNLNDERKPSQNGAWSPDKLQAGEKKTIGGTIDYYYDSKDKGYTINGIVDFTHADFSNMTSRNTTTFLPSGNRYGYSFQNQNNTGLAIKTNHRFFKETPKWILSAICEYRYGKARDRENMSGAEFSKDIQGVGESIIKDLYSTSYIHHGDIVNRVLTSDLINDHSYIGSLMTRYKYKFLRYGSSLELEVKGGFDIRHADRHQNYILNVGSEPIPYEELVRDFHDYPAHKYNIKGAVTYGQSFGLFYLQESYSLTHDRKKSTSDVWSQTENKISGDGYSPSMRESSVMMVPDINAGYRSEQNDNIHEFLSQLDYTGRKVWFQIKLPVRIVDRNLWYTRSNVESNPKATDVSVNPDLSIFYFTDASNMQKIDLSYSLIHMLTEMVDLVDIPNTTDPLNIFIGNPDLKNIVRHNIDINVPIRKGKTGHDFNASYTYWHNAIARGFNYDPATGVRTYTPMNIDGNNEWRASYSFDVSFGHMDRFSLSNTLDYRRLTNYDFVSEDEIEMTKSRVRTLRFSDCPKLSYGFGGNKVTLFGDLSIAHYTGSLQSFRTFNAGDINYGVSGTFKLPCNFGITTDFTIYMRRGYNDQALNTNNYVWNARLSYSIPKAHLLFMVDGWDLLHDIKNVSYTVNAQGRTETYTTILPRYVMLHVQWNFNKQPKK